MMQKLRRMFRCSPAGTAGVLVSALLLLGISPCIMAAPMDHAGDHDCPHCETDIVAVAPDCEAPADAVPLPGDPDGPVLPVAPVRIEQRPAHVSIRLPRFPAPHERSLLHRYCRLLE